MGVQQTSMEVKSKSTIPLAAWPRRSLFQYVVGVILAALVLVPFLAGPALYERDQSILASELKQILTQAATAANTEDLSPLPSQAFAAGTPIAVIEIPTIGLQDVVVEGSDSAQTAKAVGHLFGSSGLGQQGNAVLVGRRAAYGAPFMSINALKDGDKILLTTLQGRQEYVVDSTLVSADLGPLANTADNRLTLVTSTPEFAATSMLTVTAKLSGKPFVSYPQNAAWLATHPLGDSTLPISSLLVLLGLLVGLSFALRLVVGYFSKITVITVATPILLAQSVLVARLIFEFLPPSL
jgi:sortase A